MDAIVAEADKVIKKVWDEVGTFYNEESDDSRRDNCREWGVVYVSIGSDKVMRGTVSYYVAHQPMLLWLSLIKAKIKAPQAQPVHIC